MSNYFNRIRKSLTATLTVGSLLLSALVGCEKRFNLDLPLAVASRELSLTKESGSTHILVYSDGDWTARLSENVEWASIDRTKGHGNYELVFSYSANYGISRKIGLILNRGELADTVVLSQAGEISDPQLSFSTSGMNLLKSKSSVRASITTNLLYMTDALKVDVVYYDENGLANDPVPAELTRADGDEDEKPTAVPVNPWISNVAVSRKAVTFDVDENTGSAPRTADVILYVVDAEGQTYRSILKLTQGLSNPEFSLAQTSGIFAGQQQECIIPATSNNISAYSSLIDFSVSYAVPVDEGMEWVKNVSVSDEGLVFNLLKNEGKDRKATVSFTFADGLGNSVSASYEVTQSQYPVSVSFPELYALGAGEIKDSKLIDAYVISERGSKNVISSPQTAQFKFDRTLTDKTAYVMSLDGKLGLCLMFESSEDLVVDRYSKVRISLQGLTLEKHSNPDYYTLKGLTAENILEASAPDEFKVSIVTKSKTIAELTDDDIFTLVDVRNLEIMDKAGSFTNLSDGYTYKDTHNPSGGTSPRADVAPLLCYDNQGSSIYMLTNTAVPWRRDGKDLQFGTIVPQGSGTFRAIVVNDDPVTVRWGNLGRYQLRAMVKDDIALTGPVFAKTIVEWNWNARVNRLSPDVGSGTLKLYSAKQTMTADYNNVQTDGFGGSTSNQKGLVANGSILLTQEKSWWDFTADEGRYFDVECSTKNISGTNLMFGITWGHGQMNNTTLSGPAHWNLLYSVDGGTTFKEANPGDIIRNRSIVWWTTTSQDSCPGYTEHLRKLPNECFGKEKLVIRLKVADTVTDTSPATGAATYLTNLGIEKGKITSATTAAAQSIRVGAITLKYN